MWIRSFFDDTSKLHCLLRIAQFFHFIILLFFLFLDLGESLIFFLLFLLLFYDLILVFIVIEVIAVKAVSEEH